MLMNRRCFRAFTLIELLTAIAILAILAALVLSVALPALRERSRLATSTNNLRQIGAGFFLYAADNDNRLPGHAKTSDKWPRIVHDYVGSTKILADPSDTESFVIRQRDPLSNASNYTSYIMNGYNDLGALQDETVEIRLNAIPRPSQVILAGVLSPGRQHFYMDAQDGDQDSVLNKSAYRDGSPYVFADGSARFIREVDHRVELWMMHPPGSDD